MIEQQSAILQQGAQNRAQVVAASRFFNNQRVTPQALSQALIAHTKSNIQGRHLLCIQDTTEVNYKHQPARHEANQGPEAELGPLANKNHVGFLLHPTLVLDADTGFARGLGDIKIWNRTFGAPDKYERDYPNLPREQKESYRWIEASHRLKSSLSEAEHLTIIADREADIYDEFSSIPDARTDVLIRSRSDRRITQGLLYSFLAQLPCQGVFELSLRGRKHRKPRQARFEVRFAPVSILRPKLADRSLPAQTDLWGLEIREVTAVIPKGEELIIWRLLSTHPITDTEETSAFECAMELARFYSARWWIEQLFRVLKTKGLRLESSQLEDGLALKRLAILSLHVALIVLQLVTERGGSYGASARVVFTEKAQAFLQLLQARVSGKTLKQQCPHAVGTLAWSAWVIGRLGGWMGYARAAPPGPITMKRGLDRFWDHYQGWLLGQKSNV